MVVRSKGRHPFDKLRAGSGCPYIDAAFEIKLNHYRVLHEDPEAGGN